MNTAELQFNIIYSPYTVEYLSQLIYPLLKWTDCRYRIVTVACSDEDCATLRAICAAEERLEFLVASDELMEHGKVLTWLHERTDSPWFCFMDSDILATGPFIEDIAERMTGCDVFSTGHPLWYSNEDIICEPEYRRLHGIYFGTSDGLNLGGTYFAIYNNEVLTSTMRDTGVDFRIYLWNTVPDEHRATLAAMGMEKLEYDTGKLLMLLMAHAGAKFQSADLPAVRHLGGFSARAGDGPACFYRGTVDRLAVKAFGGLFARPLLRLMDYWYAWRGIYPDLPRDEALQSQFAERRLMQTRVRKRINTARYFNVFLRSLLGKAEEPRLPVIGQKSAEQRISEASDHLRAVYADAGKRDAANRG